MEQLHTQIHGEQEKLKDCIDKIESETLMSKQTPHSQALLELKKLQQTFEKSQDQVQKYRQYEQILRVTASKIPEIDSFNAKFAKRGKLWNNWDSFIKKKEKWYKDPFKNQAAEDIVKQV